MHRFFHSINWLNNNIL